VLRRRRFAASARVCAGWEGLLHRVAGVRLHRMTSLLVAALAVVITVAAVSASASGSTPTFETGIEPFTNLECANPSTQFVRVTSPVREGSYAAKFSETATDVWLNGSVRCLAANYGSGETTGDEYWYHVSYFIPSTGITSNLLWELHHPSSLYNLAGCGVAPFAILTDGTQLLFRIGTGDCKIGSGWSYWEPKIAIPGMNPYPRNVWIDLVVHIKFEETSTGVVEVYARTAGNVWPSTPQVSRYGIPTMPYCSSCGVHNVSLYWETGLYPGYSGYSGNDSIYIDDWRRETSLAAAEGTSSTTSTPSYSYTSSIVSGATLTGTELWTVTTTNPAATNVGFYADNTLLSTQPVSGGTASYQLDLPSTSTGGAFRVYDSSGSILYSSPPIAWTVTPPLSVTESVTNGQTLTGTVGWTATPSASVTRVDFSADGVARASDTASPYAYSLDTTTLANGTHTLTARAVASDGSTASASATVSVQNATTSSTTTVTPLTVTSNIVDGQTLRKSQPWTATPNQTVASVEFWIDGVLGWSDSAAPYSYNGDTGVLDPHTLGKGTHTLTVKAIAADGRTATSTTTVTVNSGRPGVY
jgi:hypothetical protein